ncbi:hypothetical protein BO99DRAFT_107254 [Aspergillus violaceofuscus CBS 115571]|uniref:Uncharacterized protein n=1 Tax=Aspergillus violaceofuscus (strain CBS 115571) TaxID=1450538 RepID=A0A2V5H8A0_ASPV1|nr:hypothetical protein BO99DRAFT_107254 [Aspergillus violaceofuscus CBS 115571]
MRIGISGALRLLWFYGMCFGGNLMIPTVLYLLLSVTCILLDVGWSSTVMRW